MRLVTFPPRWKKGISVLSDFSGNCSSVYGQRFSAKVNFLIVVLLECKPHGIRILFVCLLHFLTYPMCLEWYLVHIKQSKKSIIA